MKITENNLRIIIREELAKLDEMGLSSLLPGVGREEFSDDPSYVAVQQAATAARKAGLPIHAVADAVKRAYGKGS